MKAVLTNTYTKSVDGKVTTQFVYAITSASETELALYKSIKKEYYREDDNGKPLYWTNNPLAGKTIELQFNYDNTKVYLKNESQRQLESVAQYYGASMKDVVTNMLTQQFGALLNINGNVPASMPAPSPVQAQQPEMVESSNDDPFEGESDDDIPF